MDYQQYQLELERYNNHVKHQLENNRNEYLREDYTEEEYEWSEYLDYCADWKYQFNHIAKTHMQNFIVELAKRSTKMVCGDHTHEFSYHLPTDDIGQTSLDGPRIHLSSMTMLPLESCWYKKIRSEIEEFSHTASHHWVAANLPDTMIRVFSTLIRVELEKANLGFEILPYDVFTSGQWQIGPKGALTTMAQSKYPSVKQLMDQFLIERSHKTIDSLSTSEERVILFDTSRIYQEHGFHTFITAVSEPIRWINKINALRRKDRNFSKEDAITLRETNKAINKCAKCANKRTKNRALTIPGIYYAPPGNGKTTMCTREEFVGFDTDWTTSNIKWTDFTDIFFEDIPILTNQYDAFQKSGMLTVGSFNNQHLRVNPATDEPWTTWEQIEQNGKHRRDLIISRISKRSHMNREITKMMFANYIRQVSLMRFMKKRRSKIKAYWLPN